MPHKVVIAGGGVAALEAALALRALADERVEVELVAPETAFWYRPLAVAEPFQAVGQTHYALPELASRAGATFTLGAVASVDTTRRVARTAAGAELPYDSLLLALGARPQTAVHGALTFRGPADVEAMHSLVEDAVRGNVHRIAFAVPWGAVWSLPIYELALLTAGGLRRAGARAELHLVTPEDEPLQLFGPAAWPVVRALLADAGVELHTGSYPVGFDDGELRVIPHGGLAVDRVVALPRLRGQRIGGLAQTGDGFVGVDGHGRVVGAAAVYAAGDITTFPVKQGGIATQQADAAAQAIAAEAGADVTPEPFRPVLRGMLLTGGAPAYLRNEPAAAGDRSLAAPEPLWWPPAKIVGKHFAPFFAELASLSPSELEPPEQEALAVDVDLSEVDLEPLTAPPATLVREAADAEEPGVAVAHLMTRDPVLVAPEDTLGEVAERLRELATGTALVADYGRLVGILTGRDLVRAYAERIHPSEGRVREWMTSDPITLSPDTPIEAAGLLMAEHGFHHLPVVEGDRPVGLLGMRALTRFAALRPQRSPVGLGL